MANFWFDVSQGNLDNSSSSGSGYYTDSTQSTDAGSSRPQNLDTLTLSNFTAGNGGVGLWGTVPAGVSVLIDDGQQAGAPIFLMAPAGYSLVFDGPVNLSASGGQTILAYADPDYVSAAFNGGLTLNGSDYIQPVSITQAADTAAVIADQAKILPTASNIAARFGVTGTAPSGGGGAAPSPVVIGDDSNG